MEDEDILREKLAQLIEEHKDLDSAIDHMTGSDQPIDFMQMARMKKRKLQLKDMIQKIEDALIPDIIA